MKASLLIGMMAVLTLPALAKADESLNPGHSITGSNESHKANPRTYSFRPCNSWSYSSEARGYVCSITSTTMYVTDVRDVAAMANTITQLQSQIAELTKRVEALESGSRN
jgi:hypothetical protein